MHLKLYFFTYVEALGAEGCYHIKRTWISSSSGLSRTDDIFCAQDTGQVYLRSPYGNAHAYVYVENEWKQTSTEDAMNVLYGEMMVYNRVGTMMDNYGARVQVNTVSSSAWMVP